MLPNHLLSLVHRIQRPLFKRAQIVEQVMPVLIVHCLAVDQWIRGLVPQSDRVAEARIPLSSQAVEQLKSPPVVRPNFGEVFRSACNDGREKWVLLILCRGRSLIERCTSLFQFPTRPSAIAAR